MGNKKGYIGPSGLISPIDLKKANVWNRKFKNTPLRVGVITKRYEKNDKSNISKTVPEYDVAVNEATEEGQSFKTYPNCISTDNFGGIADFFQYKHRPSEDGDKAKKNNGSMVLLLCIDGYAQKSVIIGGISNLSKEESVLPDEGLFLHGEYNGMNWQINEDGEFTLTFKSKTDNTGKPQDETSGGSNFKIDKKGSISLDTALDDTTNIILDKENKDVNINTGNNLSAVAKTDVAIEAGANIVGKAKGSVDFSAEGTAKITAKSSLNIEGKSLVGIKSDNLEVNCKKIFTFASETFLGGKVYVGDGGAPAVIGTTKFIGTGNHGAPVVCSAVGPFSSNVFIAP